MRPRVGFDLRWNITAHDQDAASASRSKGERNGVQDAARPTEGPWSYPSRKGKKRVAEETMKTHRLRLKHAHQGRDKNTPMRGAEKQKRLLEKKKKSDTQGRGNMGSSVYAGENTPDDNDPPITRLALEDSQIRKKQRTRCQTDKCVKTNTPDQLIATETISANRRIFGAASKYFWHGTFRSRAQ